MLAIARESPRQDEVSELLRQADEHSAALYPSEGRHPIYLDTLQLPNVGFFVARLDGRAVGCGALVSAGDGDAELKRMIVDGAARGQGVGRAILEAIEDAARREGVTRILLETGPKSLQALALYRRSGYRERGPFGAYRPSPFSVFMEKRLTSR